MEISNTIKKGLKTERCIKTDKGFKKNAFEMFPFQYISITNYNAREILTGARLS